MAFFDNLRNTAQKSALGALKAINPIAGFGVGQAVDPSSPLRTFGRKAVETVKSPAFKQNFRQGADDFAARNQAPTLNQTVSRMGLSALGPLATGLPAKIQDKVGNASVAQLGIPVAQGAARLGANLALTAPELYAGKKAQIKDTQFTRDFFGSDFLGGDKGGQVSSLTEGLRQMNRGEGAGGTAAKFLKEKANVPTPVSAIGLGLVGGFLNAPGGVEKGVAENSLKLKGVAEDVVGAVKTSEEYLKELKASQKAARKVGEMSWLDRLRDAKNEAGAGLMDATTAIGKTQRNYALATNSTILPSKNIDAQISKAIGAHGIADQALADGGIYDVIKNVPDVEDLDQFLIARQARDVAAQGKETGRNLAADEKLIQDLEPVYGQAAEKVNAYSRSLLDYGVSAGLVSQETADHLKALYPNYVPLKRIFSEMEEGSQLAKKRGTGGGQASLSGQTFVRKLEGSERDIESPMASIIEQTRNAYAQGEKNKAAQLLTDFQHAEGNPFNLRLLAEGEKPEAGMSTISAFRNGVKQTFETTPDIADAAKGIGVEQLPFLLRLVQIPIRLKKLGTTAVNVGFGATNPVKDIATAAVNSPDAVATLRPDNVAAAIAGAIGHGNLYEDAVRDGALMTSFDNYREFGKNSIEKIRSKRSIPQRVKYLTLHPGEALRAVEDFFGRSEEAGRLAQYRGIRNKALNEGANQESARIMGAEAARWTTANFARRGRWGGVMGAFYPYLRASIQGTRAFGKAARDRPIRTAAGVMITEVWPEVVATAWNLSDPERALAYQQTEDYDKDANFIIVPPHPEKDEQGRWKVIKIPKAPGIGKMTIPARRLVEYAYGKGDGVAFTDIANAALGPLSPIDVSLDKDKSALENAGRTAGGFIPQQILPTVQAVSNYDFYTGKNIVPDNLKDKPAEYQAYDWTSGTARKIAGALGGASPIKTEKWIRDTTGGTGSNALHYSDVGLAAAGVIPKDQIGGEGLWESVSRRFSRAAATSPDADAYSEVKKYMTQEETDQFVAKKDAQALADRIKELPLAEQQLERVKLRTQNPSLFKKVDAIFKDNEAGITSVDKAAKSLGVENGMRAQYVYDQMQKMPESERDKYLTGLRLKKVVTKEVYKQILRLQTGLPPT